MTSMTRILTSLTLLGLALAPACENGAPEQIPTAVVLAISPMRAAYRTGEMVQVTATVFVLAFVPTIIAVFGEIPENAILPTVKIPWWFGPSWFTILAGVLTTTMVLTRSK